MKNIFLKIKVWFESYRDSMLKVDNKNLSTASKVSLAVFVLIVFAIIGSGVETQQSSIVKPYQKFSHKCMNFLEQNREIDKFQKRDVSKDIYGESYNYKYWHLEDFKYNHHRRSESQVLRQFGTSQLCQDMAVKYLDLANSDILEDKLIIQKGLKSKIALINNTIEAKTEEYSNDLLENIAKQKKEYSILSTSAKSIKNELHNLRAQLRVLEQELGKIEDITSIKEFQSFKKYLDEYDNKIVAANHDAVKYYRLEYTTSIFLFLFPVWFIFYLMYRVFKKRGYYVSSYLSVNVANVSALFIIFNIFLLIYTIIPKVFLGKLLAFLSQYNLTLILNITANLFFMLLFGFFIHRIQKNSGVDNTKFNQERVKNSRIKDRNSCSHCGNKYNKDDKFCGVCARELKVECKSCQELVSKDYPFCTHCSKEF